MNKWSVIYRSGGSKRCFWRRVLNSFNGIGNAIDTASELERAGYKAFVRETKDLDAIGLPIGWEAGCVDWEHDYIEVSSNQTYWVSRDIYDGDRS
jgi:hypothetical protein